MVEVISNSENVKYELDPQDVKNVFEKFGKVSKVEVQESCNKAVVTMEDPEMGKLAEKHLNFYQLPGTEAYLTVKWQFDDYEELQRVAEQKKPSFVNAQNSPKESNVKEENSSLIDASPSSNNIKESSGSVSPLKSGISKECTSVSKFTAKYEIPIRNLPGFCIARKIIGHRGKNMKYILGKLKENNFNGPIQDVTKLRLRGQGSGFKEGPNNCESPEPLHLCISSKYYEKYAEACDLVEKLLKDVYQEYNNFCRWKGRKTVNYNVNKLENNPAWYLSN